MSTELTKSDYFNPQAFDHVQRVAKALSSSSIVPKEFQGSVSNCIVALEMSRRMNIEPFMVMQNLYIVHGRPSWKSEFVISSLRSHAEYKKIKFERDDNDEGRCRVVAVDVDGDTIEGSWVSIKMAKEEGWFTRSGSKWKTMPDQMLMYRAAAFFARVHCPEIMNGMRPADEVADIEDYRRESAAVQAINDEIKFTPQVEEVEEVTDELDDI